MTESFKLTYATMFNPPEELHTRFEEALAAHKASLGHEYGMIIDGKEVFCAEKFEDRSPANTDVVLGVFQKGTEADAQAALAAARKAFPCWSHMNWQERVALVRKAADESTSASLRWARRWRWKWARTAWKHLAMWPKPPI